MSKDYAKQTVILKALADPNRLKIVDLLSCGELCACDILEQVEFTQPTLSHHMKVLMDSGLVKGRKEGVWMHYSINDDAVVDLVSFISHLTSNTTNCICKQDYCSGPNKSNSLSYSNSN